jgi:hypothetical protein
MGDKGPGGNVFVSIADGKSMPFVVGSPARRITLPLGDIMSARLCYPFEKEAACRSTAFVRAAHMFCPQLLSRVHDHGSRRACATLELTPPSMRKRRCRSSPSAR